jgi:hypothetical protein
MISSYDTVESTNWRTRLKRSVCNRLHIKHPFLLSQTFSFSMCDSGESNLDVNGDEDYIEDELDSKEFYSKEDEELDSKEDCSKDELNSEEVYSKDELDADKDYSLDDELYHDDEHFIARSLQLKRQIFFWTIL